MAYRKLKMKPLKCYNVTPTFKEFCLNVLQFLLCLDPDFLCPSVYWPCCFRQHPNARMTTQQQRKMTAVHKAREASQVFEVTDAPPGVSSSFSDV
jgi:hypothetical protein